MKTEIQTITRSLVSGRQRIQFLQCYFGARLMMRGESLVYDWMSNLSRDYRGGSWQFYTLSNGGFYMAPAIDEPLNIVCAGNSYNGKLSADAAGIVANLYALCRLAETEDRIVDRYHYLRDFALSHSEARKIMRAID